MRSYKKCVRNSIGMRTYKIIGLKVSQNEQLQKTGGGSPLRHSCFLLPTSYFAHPFCSLLPRGPPPAAVALVSVGAIAQNRRLFARAARLNERRHDVRR